MNLGPKQIRRLLSCVLLFAVALPLGAAQDDNQQPISIEADQAELDERQQVSVYTGNVIVVQGGITVKADAVTVHTLNGELDEIRATGNPVYYEQLREGEEDLRGNSQQLDYNASTRLLILTRNAELWQGKNHFRGERIQYNPDEQRVIANGAPASNGSAGQRVHIILQPRPRQDDQAKP